MMTLGFIAVITALILWSVSISKSRFDKVKAIDAENQFSVVFQDFTKLITKLDINSSDALSMFIAMDLPPLMEPKTKIALGFHTISLMNKLNINYILYSLVSHETNSTNAYQDPYLRRPLEKFLAKFELSDPLTMIDFLLDTVDKDDIERAGYSEIATEDFDFREGKIYNFSHFKKIRDIYFKTTRDEKVFEITQGEFEKYFYFGEPKERLLLDCSDTKEVAPAMGLIVEDEISINLETDLCAEANSTTMQTLNKIYNISQFANKKKYLVKCILNLDVEYDLREISFDYDVSSKRISNIDKNFQEQE
jgi:hypothetical protein